MRLTLIQQPRGWRLIPAAGLLLLCALGFAQSPPGPAADPTTVVRRAVANHFSEEAAHRPLRFVLHKRDERHNIIQEIVETHQGDVAMTIAANGAPLSPQARQVQITRLDNLAAHPELQAHRLKREQEDAARVDKLMRMLPDAFLFRYIGTETCSPDRPPQVQIPGQPRPIPPASPAPAEQCYHMTFTPNPKFSPPDIESKILTGMAGDLWMEKSHERLYRLNAHLVRDVDFGWGFVGRLDQGGTVFLEQRDIGDNDWELSGMKLNLTGRILMLKSLTIHLSEEMGNFAPVPPDTDYHQAIRMLEQSSPAAAENTAQK